MKTFKAYYFNEQEIVLTSTEQIKELVKCLDDNEDFIIEYAEGKDTKSKLIIATNFVGKVKNGDFEVYAKKEKGSGKI